VNESARKNTVWALILGTIGVFAIGGLLARSHFKASPPLTAADRAAFVDETVDGHHRLRHPTLGFAFEYPGVAFVPSQKVTDSMAAKAKDTDVQFYGWLDQAQGTVLAIAVTNEEVPDRETMVKELAAMENSFSGAGSGGTAFDDGVVWTDTLHEAHFEAHMPNGVTIRVRVIPVDPKDHAEVMVAIIVASGDPKALTSTLFSLAAVH
jgi:hypothetical protein